MTQWGLDNLFNPGKRHMDDEKRRLQSTREEIGDSSGGRRIDLEAGKVSISVARPADLDADNDDPTTEPALEAEGLPGVALANDDAEIVPNLVAETSETAETPPSSDQEDTVSTRSGADGDPIGPVAAPAALRRQLSASAWSRRG